MATYNPTSVYLYFDEGEVLLYVGVTGRGLSRQREHNRDKVWWKYVRSQKIEHFDTREQALSRETQLIETFCPPFNTQHNLDTSQRDVYLRYAGESGAEEPQSKRIPLLVRVRSADAFVAVTDLRFAATTRSVHPGGEFAVSLPRQRARDVEIRRVGSALAFKVVCPNPSVVCAGQMMYRLNTYGKDIKRLDFQ